MGQTTSLAEAFEKASEDCIGFDPSAPAAHSSDAPSSPCAAASPRDSSDPSSDDWHTVTVADAAVGVDEFVAGLRADLERSFSQARRSPKQLPADLQTTRKKEVSSTASTHSCVVPNAALVRLAMLEPFVRGPSVFDAVGISPPPPYAQEAAQQQVATDEQQQQQHLLLSQDSALRRPTITLNGAQLTSIKEFRSLLGEALAASITDARERSAVQQVVMLLVHNRFSKVCSDAAKLAFSAPSLAAMHESVDVLCTAARIQLVTTSRLVSMVRSPTDQKPVVSRLLDGGLAFRMSVLWNYKPLSPPPTASSIVASLFASATGGGCAGRPDGGDGQHRRCDESAALVSFTAM